MTYSGQSVRSRSLPFAFLGIILAAALLIGSTGGSFLPRDNTPLLNASVEIKTLDAANARLNSGALRGIDVSKYQGSINWPSVAGDNIHFVFARASIGTETDEYFVTNAQGAHNNGIKVGAYHYAKFTDHASMRQEVNLFISQLRKVDITYPVALDIEANRGMSKETLTNLAIEFMDEVRAAGYTPMLYSYTNFINAYIDTNRVNNAGYEFWVANYIEEPSAGQRVWQYTSYGSVNGISGRVDLNVAYNDLATNSRIVVDAGISRSIKETLNERYGAGLPLDALNMADMNYVIISGLQTEINRQFDDVEIPVTGAMDSRTISLLDEVNYTVNQTRGNITYLIQVKLFYKGLYTQELNYEYDNYMADAIRAFQRQNNLSVTGQIDRAFLEFLLW